MAEELNEVILNTNLGQSRTGQQTVVFMFAVVLHGEYIYVAQSGPTHGFLLTDNSIEHIYDPKTAGRGMGLSRSASLRISIPV